MNIDITKDIDNATITIKTVWQHDIKTLWDMYLESSKVELWWAPEPYKAVVIHNNLHVGGDMFYYMLSPEGDKHYCKAVYKAVDMHKSYTVEDAFCDETGVINTTVPQSIWHTTFENDGNNTIITNIIQYKSTDDMQLILEMGFEEGYKQALNQLYTYLNTQHNTL